MRVLIHEITAHGQHDVVALVSSSLLLYSSHKLINARLQQVSVSDTDVAAWTWLCSHRNNGTK